DHAIQSAELLPVEPHLAHLQDSASAPRTRVNRPSDGLAPQASAISATPPATTAAPASRLNPTGSRRNNAASSVARTMLVPRTAATSGAGASRSAASTSAYALNAATAAATVDPVSCARRDRKSTRLNSSHLVISYAVF